MEGGGGWYVGHVSPRKVFVPSLHVAVPAPRAQLRVTVGVPDVTVTVTVTVVIGETRVMAAMAVTMVTLWQLQCRLLWWLQKLAVIMAVTKVALMTVIIAVTVTVIDCFGNGYVIAVTEVVVS